MAGATEGGIVSIDLAVWPPPLRTLPADVVVVEEDVEDAATVVSGASGIATSITASSYSA